MEKEGYMPADDSMGKLGELLSAAEAKHADKVPTRDGDGRRERKKSTKAADRPAASLGVTEKKSLDDIFKKPGAGKFQKIVSARLAEGESRLKEERQNRLSQFKSDRDMFLSWSESQEQFTPHDISKMQKIRGRLGRLDGSDIDPGRKEALDELLTRARKAIDVMLSGSLEIGAKAFPFGQAKKAWCRRVYNALREIYSE